MPPPPPHTETETELDRRVTAFERAWSAGDEACLEDFLPARDCPSYEAVLCELIRVDLELRWARGRALPLSDYRARHPDLFRNAIMVNLVAFEDFRQRALAGEPITPSAYEAEFGIHTSGSLAAPDPAPVSKLRRGEN